MDTKYYCEECGKEITRKNGKKRFCSKECSKKWWKTKGLAISAERIRNYRRKRYEKEGSWRDEGPVAKQLKQWMIELKSKPCSDCGGTFDICCMDFDHREGEKKSYNLGSMFSHHYSRELIEKELAKCDLVCANCHRIRTKKRRMGSGKKISHS